MKGIVLSVFLLVALSLPAQEHTAIRSLNARVLLQRGSAEAPGGSGAGNDSLVQASDLVNSVVNNGILAVYFTTENLAGGNRIKIKAGQQPDNGSVLEELLTVSPKGYNLVLTTGPENMQKAVVNKGAVSLNYQLSASETRNVHFITIVLFDKENIEITRSHYELK